MKKFKKSGIAMLVGGLLLGSGVTYATSNIFGNLDQIRENYDITFNFARDKEQEAIALQDQLDNASNDKSQLEQDISNLKQEIEDIKTGHAVEITNKNAEIQAKQDEITDKQSEVDAKQRVVNDLQNQLGELNGQLAQVEAEVTNLLNHTNAGVAELVGE